jgi:hypothetical protein
MSRLVEALVKLSGMGCPDSGFAVAHGTLFTPEVAHSEMLGPAKQCFQNAGTIVMNDPRRYLYCQGYAWIEKFGHAFEHAWVYDLEADKALEVTWQAAGDEYLGVAFHPESYLETLATYRWHAVADYLSRHPEIQVEYEWTPDPQTDGGTKGPRLIRTHKV